MTDRAWWDEDLALTIDSYQKDHRAGAEACERLLSRPGLPPHIEDCVRLNQTWYLEPLAAVRTGVFSEPPYRTAVPVTLGVHNLVPDGWSLFNPSIARIGRDWRMIVRSSNYHIESSGRYNIHDPDGIIKTRNYVGIVTRSLELGDWYPIDTSAVDHDKLPYLVQGFEDCRLFELHDKWMFSATVRDRHPDGMCQIALVDLDVFNEATNLRVVSDPRRHEKNWMPWQGGAIAPTWVYSLDPPRKVELVGDQLWTTNSPLHGPYIARSFKGGSQVIWCPDEEDWDWSHLCLVHESVDFPEGTIPRRVYQHRFVGIDHNVGAAMISLPFCFEARGIEFAAGMIYDEEENSLVISYGVNDERAMLLRVPFEQVMAMMRGPL